MVAISIVIPVFNIEKYLKKCLNSILNQTFNNYEVICVNDGSTDSSLNILEEYSKKDSRFKIINQKNQGAGAARNNGLKHAKGDFVQFLDSDDYFEPTMLEEMYNKALEFDADLVVCSCKKINEFDEIIESSNPQWPIKLDATPLNKVFNWRDYPEDILWMFCVIPWNKLCKRELLLNNNIEFQRLSSSNDVAFGHKIKICAERIVVFERQLINYRYYHSGCISQNRANHTINIIHSAKEVKDFLIKKGLYAEFENAFIKAYKNHIRSGISLCNDEQYKNFIDEFKIIYPEFYQTFFEVLKCDYITIDYLYDFIGRRQIYLWGASNFLKNILENEKETNPNILGIIDKNEASWGKDLGNYKIFPPSILKNEPADILVMIYNNYESVYKAIKNEVNQDYPNVKVLENIFLSNNSL